MQQLTRRGFMVVGAKVCGAAIVGGLSVMGCGDSSGSGGAPPPAATTTPAVQVSVLDSLTANSTVVNRVSTLDGMKINEIVHAGGKLEGTGIVYLVDGQRVQDGDNSGVELWPENKMVNVGQKIQWIDLTTQASMPEYTVT